MSAQRRGPSTNMSSYRALGIGLELGAAVGGMAVAGYFADGYFGTSPWLSLTGALLGIVGGVYNVILRRVGRARPTAFKFR